jgi:hypothetical protein
MWKWERFQNLQILESSWEMKLFEEMVAQEQKNYHLQLIFAAAKPPE